MKRRLLAVTAMLALLTPAAQGLPELPRLLQPAQCFMDCAHDGGPCCCETFGFVPPAITGHQHVETGEPAANISRPRPDLCTDGGRAVFSGRDQSSAAVRVVESRPPDPLTAWTLVRQTSIVLEPAPASPSRPRAPPRLA